MDPINSSEKSHLTSTTFFFSGAAILILLAIMTSAVQGLSKPTLAFGNCTMVAEVARTSSEQATGLSGRSFISSSQAMIFPRPHDEPYFWMKGMLTSIDIVWVSGDRVVKVDSRLPLDDGLTRYGPTEPIDWVVEVAAGRAATCGVMVGSEINGLRS